MEEKVLARRKYGMAVLIISILLYIAAIIGFIASIATGLTLLGIICVLYMCLGWILWIGLKVLKPQEALVLTLFGKYVGTLRGQDFIM